LIGQRAGKGLGMSTEPEVPTVFEVMKRAVEVCDPEGAYPETADLLARFEDRDEPVTALANPDLEITEAAALDEGVAGPVEIMTVAVGTYLAYRRDEIDDDRFELLSLAARAEFEGEPSPDVLDWLSSEGVRV
jgi:hypothetical protein